MPDRTEGRPKFEIVGKQERTPLLDSLLETAITRFRSKLSYKDGNRIRPYTLDQAFIFALYGQELEASDLLKELVSETDSKPQDMTLAVSEYWAFEEWDDFIIDICTDILDAEAKKRFPDDYSLHERRLALTVITE